jgi:hypothetical protein
MALQMILKPSALAKHLVATSHEMAGSFSLILRPTVTDTTSILGRRTTGSSAHDIASNLVDYPCIMNETACNNAIMGW